MDPLDQSSRDAPDSNKVLPFGKGRNNRKVDSSSRSLYPGDVKYNVTIKDDLEIERAAEVFGQRRDLTQEAISELAASWKSGFFLSITGISIIFPLSLSVNGAVAFVEKSIANQWLLRRGKRTAGVNVFLEQNFGHIFATNQIPVSLVEFTDLPLYDRIISAHSVNFNLPTALIYDVRGDSSKRPRAKRRTRFAALVQ